MNLASIGYYFGDKAGLYRAAFFEPLGEDKPVVPAPDPNVSLEEALRMFFAGFLAPLKQGEVVRQCMRLHFREMVDPVGLFDEEIEREIKPKHLALVGLLAAHLGLPADSVDAHRLAFAIVGMPVHVFVGHDILRHIRPDLIDTPVAIDAMAERITGFALAMVEAERKRLGAAVAAGTT